MDAVERLIGRRWDGVSFGTFLKFGHLDRPIQQHLQRVYATLAAALAIAALGCALDIQYRVAGFFSYLTGFACLVGLGLTPSLPSTLNRRYALLAGFSFTQGASLGRLVDLAIEVDSALLLTAFLGTAAVFLSFTLAALLSARRSLLFLGGWLSSAVLALAAVQLGSWLTGSAGGV
ncbi:hypothetical protein Agub_g9968, partial [Astrephomene gubernaculifera]